ncbi:MAG: type II secretion system protein GspD, partial [Thermoanaerobaculia bacterium]
MKPYDSAPRRFTRMVSIALLVLGAAGAARAAQPPGEVNLDDVPVGQALSVLAESYGLSVAIGSLPDARVTVHLRGISAEEAFAAVAAAAGLTVVRDGAVLRVSPKGSEAAALQIVPAVFPPGADANLDGLREAGVQAHRFGQGSVLLAGGKGSVEVVAAALGKYRQTQIETRLLHLGASPGEETLKAVLPLLDPCFETATFNAAENVLLVSALPATLARVDALVDVLTRTQAQYEIEVQVVEVSKNALRQMGAQGTLGLDIRGGVLATTFPLRGLRDARRFLPSANDLAAIGRLGSAGGLTSSNEPGSFADPGFRFGQIDARGVGLTIQALEQAGEAKVIATPRVTALDNRVAHISMVTTLRIPTYTQNQAFATTTVTGIEQVDVGTTLDVRPRRGNGRQIVLKVAPEVSELQPNSSVFTQSGLTQGLPVVTRRRTETEVILESGETLVIGGLSVEHNNETHGKTPGLGHIPVIGRMFRLEGKQTDSTVLLVFVTPRELPSPGERRAKVRIGEAWVPVPLAKRLEAARALLRGESAADRVAGVRALQAADADLLAAGVDTASDVAALEGDPDLDARTAAALFFLRSRPADALAELARFKDSRAVAAAALAAPLAPHLRAALAGPAARPVAEAE